MMRRLPLLLGAKLISEAAPGSLTDPYVGADPNVLPCLDRRSADWLCFSQVADQLSRGATENPGNRRIVFSTDGTYVVRLRTVCAKSNRFSRAKIIGRNKKCRKTVLLVNGVCGCKVAVALRRAKSAVLPSRTGGADADTASGSPVCFAANCPQPWFFYHLDSVTHPGHRRYRVRLQHPVRRRAPSLALCGHGADL
jgi:hypothetical protein